MTFLWWHWAIFGCVLLAAEILAINSSFLIWFGLAALALAATTAVVVIPIWIQLLLFAALSLVMLGFWFKVLKPVQRAKESKAAMRELPGYSGVVINYNTQQRTGTMRLQRPVCGKDIWEFSSEEPIKAGDSVKVESVDARGVATLEHREGGGDAQAAPPQQRPGDSLAE